MFGFKDPQYLYLLILIPLIIAFLIKKRESPFIKFSNSNLLKQIKPTWRIRLRFIPDLLKLLSISLLIIALSRPQNSSDINEIETEGIDIIITQDASNSMLARDFKPDRFGAASNVAKEFVKGRKNDRIGFVVFGNESFTQCPLTTDYNILSELIDKVKIGTIDGRATAIGNAIITSVNRLKDSKSKSKVIILLTDGENNAGEVNPETAAQTAEALGIRIYTIGIGNKIAPFPSRDFFGNTTLVDREFKIDEELLQNISEMTNGKYFKAKNQKKLEEIYKQIDKMEKTKIKHNSYKKYKEEYFKFTILAFLLLLSGIFFEQTVFKRTI